MSHFQTQDNRIAKPRGSNGSQNESELSETTPSNIKNGKQHIRVKPNTVG